MPAPLHNRTRGLSTVKVDTNSIESLIVDGLGYCCEWKFFQLYKDTELIAARLGMSERAVRRHKQWAANGTTGCEFRKNCLDKPKVP